MGENTGISWTDHTLNPWTRCTRISPGCDNCYAATWAGRATHPKDAAGKSLPLWGPDAPRDETKRWMQNLRKWDEAAFRAGVRRRVFCASLADIFEDHPAISTERRHGVLEALACCTNLDAQVLTKRPENVRAMVPASWLEDWPAHVWIGATAENQEMLDARLPHLVPLMDLAPVVFLSIEPQIGPVDASAYLAAIGQSRAQGWVIQGGESGGKARPFVIGWMFAMKAQCLVAGVPWFPKQAGSRPMFGEVPIDMGDNHGANEDEWPIPLRGCRAFPS